MRKFIVKLCIFLMLLFALQALVYKISVYPDQSMAPENVVLLDQYLLDGVDIIYFGDSVLVWGSGQEKERKTIPEMAQGLLQNYSIKTIYHEAYQTDMYLQFCRYIARKDNHPKMVIIPINMRIFSPTWDMRPGYQFEKEKIFLSGNNSFLLHLFYKPLSVFRMFHPKITQHDFENSFVFDGYKLVGRVKDYENPNYKSWSEQNMKNKIIFYYMNSLSENHRKINAIVKCADVLEKNNIKAIFYITPLDYQTGQEYIGSRFREVVGANIGLIKSLLTEKGIEPLDLSFKLERESFCWKEPFYPNEHLTGQGKRFVAEQLSRKIK